MIRGFVRQLAFRPLVARLNRGFASQSAPAVAQGAKAEGDAGLMKYVNGELVKRTELTLKKTEDIEGFVINIWKDYFRTTNKSAIKLESSLEDHGLDSLDSIELAMRIEEELG